MSPCASFTATVQFHLFAAIMCRELIIDGRRRMFAPRLGRQDCGPIDTAPPAQAPSRWHRAGRSRQ